MNDKLSGTAGFQTTCNPTAQQDKNFELTEIFAAAISIFASIWVSFKHVIKPEGVFEVSCSAVAMVCFH